MEQPNNEQNIVPTPKDIKASVPEEWQHLSVEDVKVLEAARLERIKAETELLKFKEQANTLEKQNRELKQQDATRQAFRDSGVKFRTTPAETLKLLGEIEYDAEGAPFVDNLPLAEALQQFALRDENANIVDGRSIRSLREKQENTGPKWKGDFASIKEKTLWISENGLTKFEALPTKQPVDLKGKLPQTWAEYKGLSISERARVAGQGGPGFIAGLYKTRAIA